MKFNFNFNRRAALAALLILACGGPVCSADEHTTDDLWKAIQALQAEVAGLKAQGAAADHLAELERRIDLLAAEIEKARSAVAREPAAEKPAPGLGPAASKVYSAARGVSIGGYGEAVYENASAERQDGEASAAVDRIDLLRNVLYV